MYIFGTKNIVTDNIYEAGYFALSLSHLTVAFHILFLGCSSNLTVLFAELVYSRLLGHTKYSDLQTFQVTRGYLSKVMAKIPQCLKYK
jgi:hypothetical protein